MPFTQRKQLRGRRGIQKSLGTVQVTLQLPEGETFQPGATLPIDAEIRRSCRYNCAFDEIRVRLHEVLSYASSPGVVVTESTKLLKRNIRTNQKRKTKSGVIDLKEIPLAIPLKARCDGKMGFVRISHVLEIKLMSRGMTVENMTFKFPFVIGRSQKYKIMPDNHACYQPRKSMRHSTRSQRLLLAQSDITATSSDVSGSVRAESDDVTL
mmetsp:Transcript_8803/g.14624  ORF Transcript_8803/g.14624 Transcript_8803/m.14624 type:complete len:210 (+) Transcript_8803:165-794(+)|eukprot:CAMPEP_0119012712 /NCGR_PEP_ID=MMETSP1176-20130426/7326_1 /TAXON_ID=265551 /ORGANISM="Synedropsis recta cf, Strain CCMP1620" /LENGTH=209 /DNA_ID=CAMNT_0006965725 /DNA_START=155 /DNA_END=784 /DNA_ORIENTATION=+